MLDLKESLVFPKLRFIEKVELGQGDSKPKEVPLYSLDWTYKETRCLERHLKWNMENWPNIHIPFKPDLPEIYDSYVKSLVFAIPGSYHSEIVRNARRGLEEWDVKRKFDTVVRDNCLGPAIEHIYVAFYLLSDCIYDRSAKYFDRNPNSILARYCLPYKFWSHQTGRGVRRNHARIHNLEGLIEQGANLDKPALETFLKLLNSYEDDFDQAYLPIYAVSSEIKENWNKIKFKGE